MRKIRTYRIFQFVLMAYLVSAFTWWTILLSQKNSEIYQLKKAMSQISQPENLLQLQKAYERSQWMVIGEGFVFAISILVSLLLINRAFWTEIKANKKLNNFLLSVTHELKTPISSLKLINHTLINKVISKEKSQELIRTASDETRRLESLVNNILTVTQMDNNYHYNFENFDLNEIVHNRINRLRKVFIDYEFKFESNSDYIPIKADKESLIKLIDNLLDNSIKYSDQSRVIEIKTKQTNKATTLVVLDYGIGIANHEKKRILDKFYRIGNEEVRASKGTGLGLFIVKEICKAHNASIQILDNKPRGSIFEITFTT